VQIRRIGAGSSLEINECITILENPDYYRLDKLKRVIFWEFWRGFVSDRDRESAEKLYKRLLALFPQKRERRLARNVITFPDRGASVQSGKTTASAKARHPGQSPLFEESQAPDRPRGIEGLLRQLFEEIETDE